MTPQFIADWYDAAALSAWGVGLALLYLAGCRLFNMAHLRLYRGGTRWVRKPRFVYPPVGTVSDLVVCILAGAAGVWSTTEFTDDVFMGWVPEWFQPYTDVVRAHVALTIEAYFLVRIAVHPFYKMGWLAAWCLFAVALTVWL